jgi:5'-nucleotidase (lipoprotein e(P4) family)
MSTSMPRALFAVLLPVAVSIAQSPADPNRDPAALAVAWQQHAAEYRACCLQTFNLAHALLDTALEDPTWIAALEAEGPSPGSSGATLPPAIVVDVDETVLDNSPYAARRLASGEGFDPKSWSAWVAERQATAVPGALAFLTEASRRGVTVFYVTNREFADEPATRDNLLRLGFPVAPSELLDVVLTKRERDDWGSDKGTRRRHIATSFRIVMLFGDDLGDFLSAVKPTQSPKQHTTASLHRHGQDLALDRLARTDEFAAHWGTRWFMLPNPSYGSWLDTLACATLPQGATELVPDHAAALRTKQIELREPSGEKQD